MPRVYHYASFSTWPQVVLLLDALDEADPLQEQLAAAAAAAREAMAADGDSMHGQPLDGMNLCIPAGNRLLHLLQDKCLRSLPDNVRFIITTRADAVGGRVLEALRSISDDSYAELKPQQLREDRLSKGDLPHAPDGVMLVHTVQREVCGQDGMSDQHATLGALYKAFSCSFELQANALGAQEWARVKGLVDVILAAQEPVSLALLQQMGLYELRTMLPGWKTLYFESEHHQ